jgi:peptidyl-prolyl cis-trans isomerase D
MMQWMHQLTRSWVAQILMGLLSLSFVVWGIGDVFTGDMDTTAIKVGNTAISADAFSADYRRFVRRASQSSKTDITPDEARKQGLPQIAEQQLISRTVLVNMARKMGAVASPQAAATEIRGIKAFEGANGTFDHNVFLRAMDAAGYTEDSFIGEVRADLTVQMLQKVVTDGFAAPNAYTLTLLAYLGEQRAADYIVVTPAMVGAIPTPSDAVLAAYVKAHAAQFSTPEYRDVNYAEISPQDVMGQIAVSEAQIKQQYEAQKASYVIPEKRTLQQLEFPTQSAAIAAHKKLAGGMSFEALAAGEHKTPAQIALGTLAATDILDATRAKAAFSLPLDGVSQPLKGVSSWVLLHVTKIIPGQTKTLADVHDTIEKSLAAQLAQSKMTDIANAFSDARAAGDDIAQAAKKAGMKSGHITVDSNGLAPDGQKIAAAGDPDFLSSVFKSEVGDDVDPFPTKAGAYFAFKVNGTTPPKLKSLDAVRAQALAAWTSQQRGIRLQEKVRALAAQAQKAGSLAGIAKELGASVQKSPALDRNSNNDILSLATTAQLFDAPPGGIVAGPGVKDGNYVIAKLTGIAHPQPPGGKGYLQYAMGQLSGQIAQDIPVALANAGRAEQGVKINQKLIDTAIGTGS